MFESGPSKIRGACGGPEPARAAEVRRPGAGLPVHLLLAAWLGLVFLVGNWFPLRATDLWCHVGYGHWILDHRALPERDPLCPLATVTPLVDTAWLSQVVFALVERAGGVEWISHGFALVLVTTHAILARTFYLQSQSVAVAWAGSVAAVVVGWSRIATVRPENFASLAMAVLLWIVVSSETERRAGQRPRRWPLGIGAPLVMLVWANLHGSFVCGLAVLGCCLLGRAIEAAWAARGIGLARALAASLTDPMTRRWLGACLLGAAATLVNPYGARLWRSTLSFVGNENLRGVVEWMPMTILGPGGRSFALSWVVLLVALRHSRRPVPVAHALMLALFSATAVSNVRMIAWYAPVFAMVVVPHAADLWRRCAPEATATRHRPNPLGRVAAWVLLGWIAFALAPISAGILGRKPRPLERLLGPSTPVALTRHLREHPPPGPVFHPQWWGDWLAREGITPFVTSNIHLVPPETWRDYTQVASGLSGWQQVVDRYGIQTLILDRAEQGVLIAAAARSGRWQPAYEDAQAVVFVRRPAPPSKATVGAGRLGA